MQELILPDLSKTYQTLKNKIKNYKGDEFILPENFKSAFSKTMNNNESIRFNKYNAVQRKENDLVVYIPNQWFYLASVAIDYTIEITKYKIIIEKYFTEKRNLIDTVRDKPTEENINDLKKFINTLPLISENKFLLFNFLTDYKAWGGGKSVNRADFLDSPIMSTLNVINNSSSHIVNINKRIISDSELTNYAYQLIEQVEAEQFLTITEDNKTESGYNKLFYGAPGTGKSYKVDSIVRSVYPNYDVSKEQEQYVFRTTIFPDYDYYNFVGHLQPKSTKDKLTYEFVPGIFTRALSTAINTNNTVFLIIEELSRGNIASIFGDIFQLLDRSSITKQSEYGISNENIARQIYFDKISREDLSLENKQNLTEEIKDRDFSSQLIKIPSNLVILGTVNTSDQNVFVMDTAFKRRFEFEYIDVSPIKTDNGLYINNFLFTLNNDICEWIFFYQALNQFFQDHLFLSEDKFIGPFFIKGYGSEFEYDLEENIKRNTEQIKNKLLQYLWDDIHKLTSMSNPDKSIFDKNYNSFSKIYAAFNQGENIFNSDIISYFELIKENNH